MTQSEIQGEAVVVLLADDEPSIRDLLRRALEMDPYTVDLAENGEQAWSKICQRHYDCIIMDLKMPGMSGQELFHDIEHTGTDVKGGPWRAALYYSALSSLHCRKHAVILTSANSR